MNPCRVRLATILIFLALSATEASACGLGELKAFEEKAQALVKDAELLGTKLLDCPAERREAFQWLYFVSAMRGQRPQSSWRGGGQIGAVQDKNKKTRSSQSQTLDAEIDAVYGGSVQKLKSAVDTGDPNYTANFEVQIAIARAMFRQGQFAEGRQYFDSALRLGFHDARFDIERLFSFIWEKNFILAEREIGRLSYEGGSSASNPGLKRAQNVINYLKGRRADSAGKQIDPAESSKVFAANVSYFNISQEFRRYSGSLEYHDGIDVFFAHHMISSLVYERKTNQLDVLWLGRENLEYRLFQIGGKIGYRTLAQRERFLFDAYAGVKLFEKALVILGVNRTSLMEIIALPEASLDLVQDSLYGRVTVGRFLVGQTTVARDTDRPAFMRHKIGLEAPIGIFGEKYGKVFGLLGSEYEARQRPSPDYETYRQGVRTHVGTRFVSQVQADTSFRVEIKYQNIQRQGHGMTNWAQNSGLTAHLDGTWDVDQKWSLVGRIAYNGEETLRPTQPFQNRIAINIGANLLR